jgi:biotin carboxylase
MILGAGVYQAPLIRCARDLGWSTAVVTPPGPWPGLALADRHIPLDIRDRDGVLQAARELEVAGILTTGSDVGVPTIGAVVDGLGLAGTGYEAAVACSDKQAMKRAFQATNTPTADYRVAHTPAEARAAVSGIGLPALIKPPDSSGSRGVTVVRATGDLAPAFDAALAISRTGGVVVEQFLSGRELGAQVVVVGATVHDCIVHNDTVWTRHGSVPVGHSLPSREAASVDGRIGEILERAITGLGIRDTIVNADVILVDDEPYVLEIGARMGGTCLPETISLWRGFDAYQVAVALAVGEKPRLEARHEPIPNASRLLWSDREGTLRRVGVPPEVTGNRALHALQVDVTAGQRVPRFRAGNDRLGHLITVGPGWQCAEESAERLAQAITIELVD